MLSHVLLFATPWTVAAQAPLSMNSPGLNTGVGSPSLLQGIFPTQGSNPGLLHCRQMLYCLSHEGSTSLCFNLIQLNSPHPSEHLLYILHWAGCMELWTSYESVLSKPEVKSEVLGITTDSPGNPPIAPHYSARKTIWFYLVWFSYQSQRKAMPKNAWTTAQLHSSHTLVK